MSKRNNNVCIDCSDLAKENIALCDTGVCGVCGHLKTGVKECFDSELIDLYHGLGFDNEFIFRNLPRLRDSFIVDSENLTKYRTHQTSFFMRIFSKCFANDQNTKHQHKSQWYHIGQKINEAIALNELPTTLKGRGSSIPKRDK